MPHDGAGPDPVAGQVPVQGRGSATGGRPAGATPEDEFSLDARVFDMASSTASRVDPDAPTRFWYHERAGVLWGEYTGDTVVEGHFVGARRHDTVSIRFTHAGPDRVPVVGSATSRVSRGEDGGLVLTEDFPGRDGTPQRSVCREVTAR